MPSIDIAANTQQAQRAVKDLGKEFESVADTLDDVARDGDRSLEKMEGSFKELSRTVSKSSKNIGDDTKKGFHQASEGAQNFKEEGRDTAREVAASFDGSAESIAGGFQEVAANAFVGFGPAGAAAGIAAAAGLGAVMTAIQAQDEALNKLREHFADVYRSAAEDGRTYLDEAQIQAGVLDLIFDSTDNFARRKEAAKEAKLLGTDLLTVARARAGSEEDINRLIDSGTEKARQMNEAQQEASGTTSALAAGVQNIVQGYRDQLTLQHQNADAAKLVAAGVKKQKDEQIKAAGELQKALQRLVSGKYEPVVKVRVDRSDWDNWRPAVKKGIVQSVKPNGVSWQ